MENPLTSCYHWQCKMFLLLGSLPKVTLIKRQTQTPTIEIIPSYCGSAAGQEESTLRVTTDIERINEMKLQIVGSHTPPKGDAMPEDCIRCHNAEWGTIVVDSICIKCLVEDNTAIREAGEKMAKQLKDLRGFQEEAEARGVSSTTIEVEYIFNTEDAAALAEWEAANK